MKDGTGRIGRFDAFVDALASRIGIIATVILFVAVNLGAAHYLQTVVRTLDQNHAIFRDRQARNGYVAMSDIQRLILVVQQAVKQGGMSDALDSDFRDAADILYVRTDNFGRILKSEVTALQSGERSIAALETIVAMADTAIAEGYPDVEGMLDTLIAMNDEARIHLTQFLDEMRREAEDVLAAQLRAVRKQQIVVIASLAGLTAIGGGALFLLRLEVVGRRAREIAERKVAFLAYFDPLTELPNRSQFQERLTGQLDRPGPAALLFVDLDDFKLVNDTYGHAAGDAVLCHVAETLRNIADERHGFAARLGGDEFALVVPGDDIGPLSLLCEEIIARIGEPFSHDGEIQTVGVSVGLATTTQARSLGDGSVDMLCRVADFALYNSKLLGRRRHTVYDEEIEQRFLFRRAMVEDLPKAITRGDLEVHLQPKVTLPDARVYGFEAVVRWRRDGVLVPPGDFITVAEESGVITDIDHFVLDTATAAVADWNARHGTDFSLSVNLSTVHFNTNRICSWVENALWQAALPAHLLTLEVTETAQMNDWKKANGILADLRALGCRIAIDDFGTGFSSLAYLRTMQANELKIDRSLVSELEVSEKARLLLASVLEIARNLELDVTIEGIETEAQAEIANGFGAVAAQGFLFGRPVPALSALEQATKASNGAALRTGTD